MRESVASENRGRIRRVAIVASAGLLAVTFVGCAGARSSSHPAALPSSIPAALAEEALRQTLRLSAVHDVKHPEYADGLKALVTAPDEDGGYALGFYRRNGESFEIVGTSMEVFGCALPTVRVDPATHLPALRAPMREAADAELFFIQNGALQSSVEHPETWTVIKKPSPEDTKQ